MAALDLTKMTGLVKKIYADTWVNAVPESAWTLRNIKFQSAEKGLGDTFEQLVLLSQSHGVSYGGTTGSAYALVTPIPMQTYNASVKGYEMTLREQIAIGALKRAANNRRAFADLWGMAYEQMTAALSARLEITNMHGGRGIGTVASSVNASSTTTTITLTAGSWAAAMWSGFENAPVDFYTSNTTLISSAANSIFTITQVNPANRTALITGTSTGITALDSAIGSNPNDVYVYFAGSLSTTPYSSFGNEATSIYTGISTTSGAYWGINATTYSLWKGNTYSAGSAAFNFGKANEAVAQVVSRTGAKGDFVFLVSPKTWNNLNTSEAANRRYDSSYSKSDVSIGSTDITYYGQNGKLSFVPHIYQKEGQAYGLFKPSDPTVWKRVGSCEITNEFQGTSEMLQISADANSVETRLYTDQAVFCSQPSKNILITNITNS